MNQFRSSSLTKFSEKIEVRGIVGDCVFTHILPDTVVIIMREIKILYRNTDEKLHHLSSLSSVHLF